MVGILLPSALQAGRDGLTTELKNTASQNVDGATVKKVISSASIQRGSTTSIRTHITRDVDLFAMQDLRTTCSQVSYHSEIASGIKPIQDLIGDIDPGKPARLNKAVSDFFEGVHESARNPADGALKTALVASASNLCEVVHDTATTCYKAKQTVQYRLLEEIDKLNANIKTLSELNDRISQAFATGNDVTDLEDERDRLVGEIASSIAVETPSFGPDKTVMLRTQGKIILYKDQYASFSYDSLLDLEATEDGANLGIINYNLMFRERGSTPILMRTDEFYNVDKGSKLLPNGSIKAYADLHDAVIPKYISSLDNLAFNLRENLNRIHNSGSPYPGRDLAIGSRLVKLTDKASWAGEAKIAVVGTDGRPVKTGVGANEYIATELNLDLGSLSNVGVGGMASARDIIQEINAHFGPHVNQSVGMGQQTAVGAPVPGKYLLADFQMVTQSSSAGQISFDFEALNTSDFDTKIEILSVTPPAGATLIGTLPNVVSISKGEQKRTFQTIRLGTGVLAAAQDISVKIRVTGSDGIVKEGTITFNVDLDHLPSIGARISGIPDAGGAMGDFANTAIDRQSFMEASLVDVDGNGILDDYTEGYISVKTTDGAYKILMQDDTSSTSVWADGFGSIKRGFGQFFELNNLIDSTDKGGRYALDMRVRSDILATPGLFSSARMASNKVPYTVGDEAATGILNFTANAAPGDIITINGQIYTFGIGAGQITVGGVAAETVTNVVAALNASPFLRNLVSFVANGTHLKVTAVTAGTGGNAIAVHSTIAAIGAAPAMFNLADGIDKQVNLDQIGLASTSGDKSIYVDMSRMDRQGAEYVGNQYISFPRGAISALATIVTNFMTSIFESNSSSLNMEKSVLDHSVEEYQKAHGYDKDAQVQKISDLQQFYSQVAYAYSVQKQVQEIFLNMLRGY